MTRRGKRRASSCLARKSLGFRNYNPLTNDNGPTAGDNQAGNPARLWVKILGGAQIAYFFFNFGDGKQRKQAEKDRRHPRYRHTWRAAAADRRPHTLKRNYVLGVCRVGGVNYSA
jgi:hypothetical protein